MGLEITFFVGAFILLAAVLYGSLHYHQWTGSSSQTRQFVTVTSTMRPELPYLQTCRLRP